MTRYDAACLTAPRIETVIYDVVVLLVNRACHFHHPSAVHETCTATMTIMLT
jgi:hypothetical protein